MTLELEDSSQATVSGGATLNTNPALMNLFQLLQSRHQQQESELTTSHDSSLSGRVGGDGTRFHLTNPRTAARINHTLKSQGVRLTEDLPRRTLWLAGLPPNVSQRRLYTVLQATGLFQLKHVHVLGKGFGSLAVCMFVT